MQRILVTGANGFVGRALVPALLRQGFDVRIAEHSAGSVHSLLAYLRQQQGINTLPIPFVVGDIGEPTDWSDSVAGTDIIFHLAARVHVMTETEADSLIAFRRVNVEGTKQLSLTALRSNVQRLVFLSTIKVNGEQTESSRGFTPNDSPHPEGPYALSKWEAEQVLCTVAQATGLEIVIVRSPLVYGPGVKGNFAHLLNWIARGVPLPLAGTNNRRSLIGVQNLVDFLLHCAEHTDAAGETFLVSDDEALSTSQLVQLLGRYLRCPARLFPVPTRLLRLSARIVGREAMIDRLLGSLIIDASASKQKLGWTPPLTVNEGLEQTCLWYKTRRNAG